MSKIGIIYRVFEFFTNINFPAAKHQAINDTIDEIDIKT